MKSHTYAEAGVDVGRGESFAAHIGSLSSSAVASNLGGFAGGMELDLKQWNRPVLLTATDGVGTKLLVAHKLRRYDTVGIDLVAMSANDLLVCGAEPVQFLDYIACGIVNEEILRPVMAGIVRGCELAGCTLTGGETAEMPGMYGEDDFDLAGFALGIVEAEDQLPKHDEMAEGDLLLGIASDGVHSNGFTLLRKGLRKDSDLWEELLAPTRIYAREMRAIRDLIFGAAHITGGGMLANISRVVPNGLIPHVSWDWEVPELFARIQRESGIATEEMRRVFNMGAGIVMVARPDRVREIEQALGEPLVRIGELRRG